MSYNNIENNRVFISSISSLQKQFRINKINKLFKNFRNLNLGQHAAKMDFDKFSRLVRTKDAIINTREISQYYNSIGYNNKLNGQKLLTSYILKYFSNDILGVEKQRHSDDNAIIEWGEQVVELYQNLVINDYNSFNIFGKFLMNYEKALNMWLEGDKNRTMESIIISYKHRMDHIEKINSDDKLDANQKLDMVNELNRQAKDLMKSIKMLDTSFDVNNFEKNYNNIYQQMEEGYKNVLNSLAVNMKKAFSNKLIDDIKKGEIKSLLISFMEIGERLCKICPRKYKDSFSKKFDEEKLTEMLLNNDWNKEIINHINFIMDTIVMFDSKDNEEKNIQMKQAVNILTLTDYPTNIVKIIMMMNEMIDKIVKTILELSKEN